MNSGNFLLLELEEMKGCINCIKATYTWMCLQLDGNHLLVVLLKKIGFTEGICKIQFIFQVGNHYPMFPSHMTGFSVDDCKFIIWEKRNEITRKRTEVPILEQRNTVNYFSQRNIVHIKYSFRPHQTCRLQPKTFVHPIQ